MTLQTRTVANALAARCTALRQSLLDSGEASDQVSAEAAAERRVFDEFLAHHLGDEADLEYVYQQFLSVFAVQRRRAHGVYYTPLEVVRAQVRLAANLLESRLGCPEAFVDPRVLVVDPATGSGAYPLGVVENVIGRRGHVPSDVAQRLRLLEPMHGAAAIARARLGAATAASNGVHIEERDALDGSLGIEAPILVCLGNPPYRRHERRPRPNARTPLLEDFVEPGSGVHAKNLYNAYVYFWRWALREVFEQRRGPGIVSFLTASSYLRGPGFGGMRRLLRTLLDELWIIDLEGDHLAARSTDNVFPIRTPVAIAMGVRYATARPETPAVVHYAHLSGTRSEKLAALDATHKLSDVTWRSVPSTWCVPFTSATRTNYHSWPRLTDVFPRQLSGAQLKRTWPIAPTAAVLRERWQRLLELPASNGERAAAFRQTRDRDLDSTPADLLAPGRRLAPLRTLGPGAAWIEPVAYAYRSLDRQWVLPDARLGDFMRPGLWRIAGPRQIFLTSLLTNVLGPGPAAVATALVPDLDCFRGSFGARAVIPLWLDAEASVPNLAEGLLERLSAEYGFEVSPEHLLAYCYAVLGTPSYQRRFEDELRTPGPRVPFTARPALFRRAVSLGKRLVWLHTYAQRCVPPGEPADSLPRGQARTLAPVGTTYPSQYAYDPQRQTLWLGDGAFGPIPPTLWTFSVSGFRIVAGWLGRRIGRPRRKRPGSPLDAIQPCAWTDDLSQELLQLLWVVEATLAMQPVLDQVLGDVVGTAFGHDFTD